MDPENILRDNPGSAVFPWHAENLAREGRIAEAVDVLRRGIEANPYHAPGHSVLAEILSQLDSGEDAVEQLLSAIRLDPQSPRDLFHLSTFRGDHDPENTGASLDTARIYEPGFDETADFRTILVSEEQKEAFRNAVTPPETAIAVTPPASPEAFFAVNTPVQDHEGFVVIEAEGPEEDDFESLLATLTASESAPSAPESPVSESPADTGFPETDDAVSPGKASSPDNVSPDVSDTFDTPGIVNVPGTGDAGDTASSDEGGMEQGEYPRPLNDRPLDTGETEDAPSLENAGWNVFDEPVVQQVEDDEHDFFDVISEYRDVEKEGELGDIFTELDQNRNPEVPISEGEGIPDVRDITDSEPNEDFDTGGGPEEGGTSEEGGVPEESGGDGAAIPTLSIDEEEEYNLANFGFDSPDAGDIPVLSPEERSELLALTGGRPEDGAGYGLAGLTLDDIEDAPGTEAPVPDDVKTEAGVGIGPAEGAFHDVTDSSLSLGGAGSYFDLLSAWDEPVPPAESAGTSAGKAPGTVRENLERDFPPVKDISPVEPDSVEPDVSSTEASSRDSGAAVEPAEHGSTAGGSSLTEEQSALIRDFLDDDAPAISDASLKHHPERPGVSAAGEEPSFASVSDDSSVQYSSLDAALASYGFSIPEDSESAAPEVRPAASGTLAGESLEDLINAYRIVLDSPSRPVCPVSPMPPVDVSPTAPVDPIPPVEPVLPVEPVPSVAFDAPVPPVSPVLQATPVTPPSVKRAPVPAPQTPAVHSAGRGGSYTATMAEIYTSQGLVARAIEIYEALLAESPENERYQSRLVELKRIYEQNTDAS